MLRERRSLQPRIGELKSIPQLVSRIEPQAPV